MNSIWSLVSTSRSWMVLMCFSPMVSQLSQFEIDEFRIILRASADSTSPLRFGCQPLSTSIQKISALVHLHVKNRINVGFTLRNSTTSGLASDDRWLNHLQSSALPSFGQSHRPVSAFQPEGSYCLDCRCKMTLLGETNLFFDHGTDVNWCKPT